MLGEATLDVSGTFAGEAIRILILFAAQQPGLAGTSETHRKRSLPETSIETTSPWPRNRQESSGSTTVPADFVERLGDGAVDRDVEFWERVVGDIRNLRALMTLDL